MSKINKYGQQEVNKFANPDNWEIWDAPEGFEVIYQTFPEFTCLCPRSSYPDFATIHLITIPYQKVIELKCLKLWLNSYRDKGISHENATYEIIETLGKKLNLLYGFILMEYTARGNLHTIPMREYKNNTDDFSIIISEAIKVKDLIIKKVINRIK
jgi:7-cyano-7-deazaguanine reductase